VRKLEDLQSLAGGLRGRPLANVVYNVGTWESTRFEDTPLEELDDVMSTTLRGVVLLTRLLVEEIRSGGGLLLMIGSTSGLENEGSTAVAYSASK
jgi:short-subunit dehydrogenase